MDNAEKIKPRALPSGKAITADGISPLWGSIPIAGNLLDKHMCCQPMLQRSGNAAVLPRVKVVGSAISSHTSAIPKAITADGISPLWGSIPIAGNLLDKHMCCQPMLQRSGNAAVLPRVKVVGSAISSHTSAQHTSRAIQSSVF